MEFTEILRILAGPLIGAVIGYFTNYIAVKMLFYPKKELRLFGKRLPLTPGVIPKGRPRIASSVGEVIENHLLTREDITEHLLSERAEKTVADAVVRKLSGNVREEILSFTNADSSAYEQKKAALSQAVSVQIVNAIQSSDATETVLAAFGDALKQKVSASPLMLLVNDRTINKVMQPTKEMLDTMLAEHGTEFIVPVIDGKLSEAEQNSGLALLEQFRIDEQSVRNAVTNAYRNIVSQSVDSLLQSVNISALVEDKINAMSIDELEKLVQDVMKKELNAIINLGALIGFILGLLNLLF